jgi:hypothetical protein
MKNIKLKLHPNIEYIINNSRSSKSSFVTIKTNNNSFANKLDESRNISKEKFLDYARSQSAKKSNKKLNNDILEHIEKITPKNKILNKIPKPKKVNNVKQINLTQRLKTFSNSVNEKIKQSQENELFLNKKFDFMNKFLVFYENSKKFKINSNMRIKSHIISIKKELDEILIKNKRDEMIYFKQMEKLQKLEKEIKFLNLEGKSNIGSRQVDFFNKENETLTILKVINRVLENNSKNYELFYKEIKTELRNRRNNFIKEKYLGNKISQILFEEYEVEILDKITAKFEKRISNIFDDFNHIYDKYKNYLNFIKTSKIFLSQDILNNSETSVDEICKI